MTLLHPAANSFRWRLALAEADLAKGSFANYGLPAPDVADPRDHSTFSSQGDAGQARHGYERVEFLWERLSEAQAAELMSLIRDAKSENGGLIYLTIWTGAGYDGSPRWIDVSGMVHEPESLTANRYVGVRGQTGYDAARMEVVGLTVLNDPSSYTT